MANNNSSLKQIHATFSTQKTQDNQQVTNGTNLIQNTYWTSTGE